MDRPAPRRPAPDQVAALDHVAALAEPVRRRLYAFVAASPDAVDRDTAARGVGIGRPLAAFHLDRLARDGLLDVEFRRRSGRSGPGAGRPAKFYRRPGDREVTVALPPRSYRLLADVLAEAIESLAEARDPVLAVARQRGAMLAASAEASGREDLLALLAREGYEPEVETGGPIRLRNCPFHLLAVGHRDLICALNLALLGEVARGMPGSGVEAVAAPRAGSCCVAFMPAGERPA